MAIENTGLAIFDTRLLIVKSVFKCRLSGVETKLFFQQIHEKCKLFLALVLAMYSVYSINTPDRQQSKMLILSMNVDLRSLETEFSIADKWKSKTLFLPIFDPSSSIVQSLFDCCLSGMGRERILW